MGSRKQYPVLSSGLTCSEVIFQLPKTILPSLMDNAYLQVIVQDLARLCCLKLRVKIKSHQKQISVRIKGEIMTLISSSTWNADTVLILSVILPLRLINRNQSSLELTVDFFTSLKD